MNETAQELAAAPAPKKKGGRNRGWFRRGDKRINREGRPHGSKRALPDGPRAELAQRADRVMLLFLHGNALCQRLRQEYAPSADNIPSDAEVVDVRFDIVQKGLVLTLRSKSFPRIAVGTPIPEFIPLYQGLGNGRHWGPDGKYESVYRGPYHTELRRIVSGNDRAR
jgi:hypothetical protein